MTNDHSIFMFLCGALALNIVPGPDMLFVLAQTLRRGTHAGLAASLGIGTGTFAHIAAVALGVSTMLLAWPVALDAVCYIGAAYLAWLGLTSFRHRKSSIEPVGITAHAFRQGMLTNLFNPKVVLFFMAFLPQFVVPNGAPVWVQTLLLGLAFDCSGTAVNCLVALGGGRVFGALGAHGRLGAILSVLPASVMLVLAIALVAMR